MLKKIYLCLPVLLAAFNLSFAQNFDYFNKYARPRYESGTVFSDPVSTLNIAQADSLNPDGWCENGKALYKAGRPDEAIESYGKALAINAAHGCAYYHRAYAYIITGKQPQAQADLAKFIIIDPTVANAHFMKAMSYYLEKKYKYGVQEIDLALKADPTDPVFHVVKTDILTDMKSYDLAVAAGEKAVATAPEYSNAHNGLSHALYKKGDLPAAQIAVTKAIELINGDKDADPYLYYNNRGNIRVDLRQLDSALADYNTAISINPNKIDAYNNRGIAKTYKADFQGAFKDYTDVIRIQESGAAYNNRALVREELKEYEGALDDYAKAVALEKKEPIYQFNRGNLFWKMNRKTQACDCWGHASRLGYPKDQIKNYNKCK